MRIALCLYGGLNRELDAEGQLDTTLGVLLCAHAWNIQALHKRALRALRLMWSDVVEGLGWSGSYGSSRDIVENSFKVITYVNKTRDHIHLPAAYYFLAVTRDYRLLDELASAEMTRFIMAHATTIQTMYSEVLAGVTEHVLPHAVYPNDVHTSNCLNSRSWTSALDEWKESRRRACGPLLLDSTKAFDPLEELCSTPEFEASLEAFANVTCTGCAERLREYLAEKRVDFWERWPERLGMPWKWKDLRESLSGWVPDPE